MPTLNNGQGGTSVDNDLRARCVRWLTEYAQDMRMVSRMDETDEEAVEKTRQDLAEVELLLKELC